MILFVADRPSPKMKPGARPFEGASSEARLKEWISALGVSDFTIVNQSDTVIAASAVKTARVLGYPIIAIGNNASKALGNIPHFKVPHPSGRNRQLNNPKFVQKVLQDCKQWLHLRHVKN